MCRYILFMYKSVVILWRGNTFVTIQFRVINFVQVYISDIYCVISDNCYIQVAILIISLLSSYVKIESQKLGRSVIKRI